MSDRIVIRRARDTDADFVGGLAPSLLKFGSPAWKDTEALAPGFAEALASAVSTQDSRSAVLIAQSSDGTSLGFISLRVRQEVSGAERGHVADLGVVEDALGGASVQP